MFTSLVRFALSSTINTGSWFSTWKHSSIIQSFELKNLSSFLVLCFHPQPNMSNGCGNCDCADKAQCTKGNSYGVDIVETEKSYIDTVVMDAPAAEHDGKCKCGTSCTCVNCTCGH